MHVLPRVAELEERFGDSLVVIGVHSGKFTQERWTKNIRQACARLGVHHPVVNDRQFRVWRDYAVNAWPTVALVSPDGYLVGEQPGEFEVEPMAEAIAEVVRAYEAAGQLRSEPLDFGRDAQWPAEPEGVLRFPTRVIGGDGTLYVSDMGHHRVLELRVSGPASAEVSRVFGSGEDGYADGPGDVARFAEPQGLAIDTGVLYVADRRNHAVRAIDLADGEVTTVAGTGELGGYRMDEGPGRGVALRSPWGLAARGGTLYVTMAGSHQLFTIDLTKADHPLALLAGGGGENITDGGANTATLAQPSGIFVTGERAYFADAESSAVRWVTVKEPAEVGTVVGTDLFEFGDRDGAGDEVRLQHDLDLVPGGAGLLVADTYNSKIKLVDPSARTSTALPGDAGSGDALWEPGGIFIGEQGVLVADTNNHRLVLVDAASGELTEIAVSG